MSGWIRKMLGGLRDAQRPRHRTTRRDRTTVVLGLLRLEDRRVMSADGLPLLDAAAADDPAVTLDAGKQADDGQSDTFRVVRSGEETHVLLNDELIFAGMASDSLRLNIEGSGDDDHLVLDLSGGDLAGTITFGAGGAQSGDTLSLSGGSIELLTWTVGAGGAGQVEFAGLSVEVSGIESADDSLQAAERRIAALGEAGDVQLVGFGSADRSSLLADQGFALTFVDPGHALSVEAGGDLLEMTGSLRIAGGDVRLDAGSNGTLLVSGTIDVSNDAGGTHGGRVELLGGHVGLIGDARIDASGAAGGGTVLIGGDYQGLNPTVRNAARTYVGTGVTIAADAVVNGDGGRVILWADETTQFHGTITARGGAAGGDGGFVETSGKQSLVFRGDVDVSAVLGQRGTLLLDPDVIEIVGGIGPGADDGELDPDVPNVSDSEGSVVFADAVGATFTISEAKLESLNADVILEATSQILVSGTFDNDADGAGTEDPGTNVILIGGGASLILRTRNDAGDGTAGIDLTAGGTLDGLEFRTTGTGTITIETGTGATPQAANVRLGRLTAGGGLTVNATGTLTLAGDINAGGDVNFSGAAAIVLANSVTIDTGPTGGAGNAGHVLFASGGSIDATVAGAQGLSIDTRADGAGTDGNVTLSDLGTTTRLGQVSVIARDGTITLAGDQVLTANGDVTFGSTLLLTADTAIDTDGGAIDLSATTVTSDGGGPWDLVLDTEAAAADSGDVTLGVFDNSGGNFVNDVTISATGVGGAAGLLSVLDAIALDVNAADAGDFVYSGGGMSLAAVASISTTGTGTVSLTSSGDIVMADGSAIRSADGDLTLSADGDVRIGLLDADSDAAGAAGTVRVAADTDASGAGAILDNTAAETALIVGAAAELRAGTGIGTALDGLDLNVGTLAATTATGSIVIENASALVVGTVGGTSGVSITAGGAADDVSLSVASGALTVNQTISNAAGDITLTAADMVLANNAVSIGNGTLTLDATGGSIDVTTDAGAEIDADGDIVLLASSIGATNGGLDFTGDASGDSTLLLTATAAAGAMDVDFATDQLSAIELTIEDADASVDLDLSGGDAVVIAGAATTSTLQTLVTTAVQATLDVRLTETTSDLLLQTGAGTAGADVIFRATGDIVVGDAAGTAVSATPGVSVTLVADSESDGTGAIVDGGGAIALDGGDVRLVAGSGIGATGNAIEFTGLTDFAAETQTGGVFLRNSGSGDMNVTSVTTFGQMTSDVTTGSGAIHLTNDAGTITAALIQTTGGTDADDITLIATSLEINTLSATGDGDISLTTTSGDIDDADANSSITADSLTLASAGGIGLTNAINTSTTGTLSLTTAGVGSLGDIRIVEANALDTARVSTLVTAASAQTVTITSTAGPITVGGNLGNAGDHLVLIATAGDIIGGAGTLTADDLTLTAAAGGIGTGTAVQTDTTGLLSLTTGAAGLAGNIHIIEANALATSRIAIATDGTQQIVRIESAAGPITVDADLGNTTDDLVLVAQSGDIEGGGGTLTAAGLALEASTGGIGLVTAVQTNTTAGVDLVSGGAGAAGNIRIIEANALDTVRLSFVTAADKQVLDIASSGGTITVGGDLTDATDDLILTAGSIEGGLGTLTFDNLTLTATTGGIGVVTAVNSDTTGTITLSTAGAGAAGDIQLVEANGLALSRIAGVTTDATTQTVSLTSTAGPITVDADLGDAADHLTLIATSGNIVGGAGTLTADDLMLNAAEGIGSGTAVNTDTTGTISLTSGGVAAAGNIQIVEANALDTARVVLTTDVSEQLVSLTSTAGPITVGGDLGNATDDLVLIAAAGDIEGGAGTLFANDLTLQAAAGGIGLVTAVDTSTTGTLTLTSGAADAAGNISIVEANALATSRVAVTTHSSEQLVSIGSAGAITIDADLGNTTDDLSLTGTEIAGGAGTLTAEDLSLSATTGGIGVLTAVQTDTTGTITLATAGAGAAGDIQLVEANALPTSRIAGITTDASQQTVRLTSTSGPITVDANLGDAADNLVLIASSGNIEGGAGTLTATDLTLSATGGGIGVGTPVNTSTTGTLTLTTGGAAGAGNISVVEANALNTTRLVVTTAADEQVVAITSTGGSITVGGNLGNATDDLILTAGSIEGGAGTLTADDLTLIATTGGIGVGTAVNSDTVGTITLSTAGSAAAGDIRLIEANALALSRIAGVTTDATAQTISLTSTAGPLTVDVDFGDGVDHLALTATNGDIEGGAGTLFAADLTLTATNGGIGIGTAVASDTTGSITLTTGGVGAAGNIAIIEANALGTSRVAFTTDVSEQLVSLTSTAGPITVDADLGNVVDDLTLVALAGDIEGGAGTLFANDLTLSAPTGGIGLATPVNVSITGAATLTTGGAGAAGDININAVLPFGIAGTSTDAATLQAITITAAGAGDLSITSPVTVNDNLVLVSAGGIDIDATVSAVNLTLTAGGTIDVAAGARLIGGGNGTAVILAATDVVLGAGASAMLATVTNTGTGTVSITTTGGDITLANHAIRVEQGLLTLSAVGSSILTTTDLGTEITADGDVTLIATSIGPANGGVDFTGDGSGDSTLQITATAGSGDLDLDWLTDQFSAIELLLDDADTDVNLSFPGGDHVEVRGETTTGTPGTSTVQSVDTSGLAATLHLELTEAGSDLLLHTGTVTAGADVCFLSTDDLVVGDAAGTAVIAGPGVNVTLIADSDADGAGAILDGGGSITMNGGGLRMTAGSGIGTAVAPIRTVNLGNVAAYTVTGGVFLLNTGSGNINVTSVTSCGATTTGVTADAGDVTLTNAAGSIGLSAAVSAVSATVTLDASAAVVDNHAGGADVVASTLVLVTGTGVATAGDPLETTVAVLVFTNTSGGVHVVNDSTAATPSGSLTVSGTSAGTGPVSITETGGDLILGGAGIVTSSGPVQLVASAIDAAILLPLAATIATTGGGTAGADITLIADNMDLAGSIDAGAGIVTLAASDAGQQVQVGAGATDSAASLGLTDTELSNVTTSGGLQIGSLTSTGGLTVVGPLDLTIAGNLTGGGLTLLSGTGDVNIDSTLTSPVNIGVVTDGGDINFGATGLLSAGANFVSLLADGGAINGNAAAFTNISARGLAAAAANGIGTGDAIETDVLFLAALNTTSGNVQIANDGAGSILTISSLSGLTGVVNQAPAGSGGDIVISNIGPLLVNAGVLATAGGDITLTASTGGLPLVPPTNVRINAAVHATGGSGNVTLNSETGLTTINNAIGGPEVRVTGAGEVLGSFGVNFVGGSTISTATGDVGSMFANLQNVVAQPVNVLGFTSVTGAFGDPGDFNFTVTADFSVDPVQSASFGPPGTFLFSQFLARSPNANPADPIAITVTLVRNARVRIVENTATITVFAAVPGEGFGAQFFEFRTEVPTLVVPEQKTATAILAAESTTPVSVQTQTFLSAAFEQNSSQDERILYLRVLRRDGSLKDSIVFRGQEAESILDNLQGFFARLPDGRYRLLLKEPSRQRLRLVRDFTLENGIPRGDLAHEVGSEGTQPVYREQVPAGLPEGLEPISQPAPEAGVPDDGLGAALLPELESAGDPIGSPRGGSGAIAIALPSGTAAAAAVAVLGWHARIDHVMETLGREPRRLTAARFGRLLGIVREPVPRPARRSADGED